MHDTFNLAWKLNLVIRGLAHQSLLSTYEEERRKIAQGLIAFDVQHCKAFSQGDEALARNFDENIRFIAGVGAEYSKGLLTKLDDESRTHQGLRPGSLLLPAKVTRYIDANPIDIQLDIPLLGQFRLYLIVPDVIAAKLFLDSFCASLHAPGSCLHRLSSMANKSYQAVPRGFAPSDEYASPQRYTAVSQLFTLALVTATPKANFEIRDLPPILQQSRWTVYLDDRTSPRCTEKLLGSLAHDDAVTVNVRPDGYVGSIGRWSGVQDVGVGERAAKWVDEHYSSFMQ